MITIEPDSTRITIKRMHRFQLDLLLKVAFKQLERAFYPF